MATIAVRVSDSSQRAAFVPSAGFHVPSLDGLRAVSFLIVFAAHAGAELVPGGFGVTVFFFLSGYLITTLLRLEGEKTGRHSLRHFYFRRLLRIWPPFYIVLLGAVALRQSGFLRADTALEAHAVASQLLHFSNYWIATHGWGGVAVGTGVYWSLAVEEHFYVAFPALFILLDRRGLTGKQKAFVFSRGAAFWSSVGKPRLTERTYAPIRGSTRSCSVARWPYGTILVSIRPEDPRCSRGRSCALWPP
jgi:peptidoglycan/LPS O-acetylase OafA/YrhL